MGESEKWLVIARTLVSVALLALAGALFIISPLDGDHPLATVIIGTVLGYWLGHAENSVVQTSRNP